MKPLLAAAVLLAALPATRPAAAEEYEATRAAAMAALEAGDCGTLWSTLWAAAKAGEPLARSDLAVLGLTEGLAAPGPVQDAATMMRDRLILAVHGLAGGDPAGRDTALALARVHAGYSAGAKALAACLEGGGEGDSCAAEAEAAGLVPPFDAFAAELDARAGLEGAGQAACGLWSDR